MPLKRMIPFVIVAFIAANLAVCACRSPFRISLVVKAVPEKGCCHHHGAPSPKAPPVSSRACCCVDGSHELIAPEIEVSPSASAVEFEMAPEVVGVVEIRLLEIPPIDGGPPGSYPGIPLYTLHATLLI